MIEEYQYPKVCPECSERLHALVFFRPYVRKPAKVLFWTRLPLMAVWCVGFFLLSPVHVMAAGHWAAAVFTALLYLGPGFILVLVGMAFSRVRHAVCRKCGYSVDVRGPNLYRFF